MRHRDLSMQILAVGLPFAFGNRMLLKFTQSSEEKDIERKFYIHYDPFILNSGCDITNITLKNQILSIIYKTFYNSQFRKRIEGSKLELERRNAERKAVIEKREILRLEQLRREEEQRKKQREKEVAIEREKRYSEAIVRYNAEVQKYRTEMAVYAEAMSIKNRYTYGGKFPRLAGPICVVLFLGLIFLSLFLMNLEDKVPNILIIVCDIILLVVGSRLIFKNLKPFLAEEHFDENGFQQWVNQHKGSPLIKYVRNSFPPSKPIPPTL